MGSFEPNLLFAYNLSRSVEANLNSANTLDVSIPNKEMPRLQPNPHTDNADSPPLKESPLMIFQSAPDAFRLITIYLYTSRLRYST